LHTLKTSRSGWLWRAAAAVSLTGGLASVVHAQDWEGYASNPQHTALVDSPAQALNTIRWQTPVDLAPPSGTLYIHYGSPVITNDNTVIVPLKTTTTGNFEVEAMSGANGSPIWSASSNYVFPPAFVPPNNWTPVYSPTLTSTNTLYYAGEGGTIDYRTDADSATGTSGQLAFYGLSNYESNPSAYNSSIFIDTPITSDAEGDIYFGFRDSGTPPVGSGLPTGGGIARIGANGSTTFISAATASGNSNLISPTMNCAPALSNNGQTLYITVNNSTGNGTTATGDLVSLNATTLAPQAAVPLIDPKSGLPAYLPDDGTASPMVGPDGHVFIGVLENNLGTNNYRGWMLQYSGNLSETLTPGAFGWDDTASVVPASMVPAYQGSSSYLIMTKYNNYAGAGTGNGENKVAILDPNGKETDPISGATVMAEVESILGPTPDTKAINEGYPNAVKEWCINTAAVDVATDSVYVNSEDGNIYQWNLATNTFSAVVNMTDGIGEAYTPTLIGSDGSIYAIQDAELYNIGAGPSLVWTGKADQTTWDTGTTNWSAVNNTTSTYVGTPSTYLDADTVTFDDSAAYTTITLNSTVSPAWVTVSGNSNNFTFVGTGAIAGATTLLKLGSSTLTVAIDNTYTGGTVIEGGAIQLGNGGGSGSLGSGPVIDDSSMIVDRSDSFTLSNTISGSGSLTQNGSGTTILTGSNTYAGGTIIGAGTLQLGTASDVSSLTSPAGDGNVSNNSLLNFASSQSMNFANNIGGTGAVLVSNGAVSLNGSNSYAGSTTIIDGAEVAITASGALPAGNVVIDNGSLLVDANSSIASINGAGGLVIGKRMAVATLTFSGVNVVNSLTSIAINGSGANASTLDLGDNALLISDGGDAASAKASIQQAIENGQNASSSNGGGNIISGYAAGNGLYIGYADGSDGVNPKLSAGQVVVEPALGGDTDLNGAVNIHDLQNLLADFNQAGFWDQGNFDGDPTVDISDLQLLLSNFNDSTTLSYSTESGGIEGLLSQFGEMAIANPDGTGFRLISVPEPATVVLSGVFAGYLAFRRRR
jgi:autotransporter-associated beta strand protein